MQIALNNQKYLFNEGETIIEVARRAGFFVPSLCYSKHKQHKASCMVCVVRDIHSQQIIPSCTTVCEDGMNIEVESREINEIRRQALELLLSDHRADCEAPCYRVCPGNFDVVRMNRLYDCGHIEEAINHLFDVLVIPATLCFICNAPCERICRKGELGNPVSIRAIKKKLTSFARPDKIKKQQIELGKVIVVKGSDPAALAAADTLIRLGYKVIVVEPFSELLTPYIAESHLIDLALLEIEIAVLKQRGIHFELNCNELPISDALLTTETIKVKQPARMIVEGKRLALELHASLSGHTNEREYHFDSTFGKLSESEKGHLSNTLPTSQKSVESSQCLYCDCDKKMGCTLRDYATIYGVRGRKFSSYSVADALERIHIKGEIYFEPSKCIRCGICVYNSSNGFTFKGRGFEMQVVIPPQNYENIQDEIAGLCPTGAIFVRK